MPTGLGDEQLWLSATNDNTGTSTAFNDQSGQGNNGTASGTLVVADTSEGGTYAFDFDGVNDYIDFPVSVVSGKSIGSVSMWFKLPTGGSATADCLISGAKTTGVGGLTYLAAGEITGLVADESLTYVQLSDAGASQTTVFYRNGSPYFYQNTWNHVVWASDSSGTTMYVNGIAVSLTYFAGSQGTPQFFASNLNAAWIGGRALNGGDKFLDGLIDDVRIYDRALTQAEITHLASQRGVEGPPPVGLGDEKLWLCPSINDSANDISGNGNNGTYNGGMGTVADTSNGGSMAYDLDGSSDCIEVPQANFSFLRETNQWSQSAWVKADSITGQRTIIGGEIRTTNYGTALFQGTSGRGLRGNRADGLTPYSPDTRSGTDLTVSQWTHVCWVVDDTTSTIYLDGVQLFQETGTFTTSSGPLSYYIFVGCFTDVGTRLSFFDGLIDDVRIFERALTQAEITHLATSRGVLGSPSTTTQYNAFATHAFTQLFQQRLR